jgi:hypothetical protein
MASFDPTYEDYQRLYQQQHGNASEGGSGGALSKSQWDAMSPDDRWRQLGGGMALQTDDPRYAGIAQQLGLNDGSTLRLGRTSQSNPMNNTFYVDPKAIAQSDGNFATGNHNLTPHSQFAGGGLSDKGWGLAALSLLGGGAALGTALGGSAAAGTGAATTGGFSGFGDIAASGAAPGAAGGAAGGASAGLPDSYWNMGADSGQLGSDAMVDAPDYVGGIDPETAAGQGGMGVSQNGIGAGSLGDRLAGAVNNPSSLMSPDGLAGSAGSSLATSAGNNPLGTARLLGGLASLGAGAVGSHNSSGSSGGAGMSDPSSIIDAMANANRVNQNTPLGSRTWTQDANGRWVATDAYTPALQHNFDALTGLNSDVIGGARSRLAAVLAQPTRRYDNPIDFMIHKGG